MRVRILDLWRPEAAVNRLPYFLTGVVLLLVKHALDWLAATQVFHRVWVPYNYFVLPGQTVGVLLLPEADRAFYGALLVLALPFIVVGVLLTVRRLQAVQLPVVLVLFFFVPVVNILLFLLLSVLPTRNAVEPAFAEGEDDRPPPPDFPGDERVLSLSENRLTPGADERLHHRVREQPRAEPWRQLRDVHRRITRDTVMGSAALAMGVVVPTTLAVVILSTVVLENYAWGLFVGTPFCMGLAVVVLFGLTRAQGLGACMLVCFVATSLAGMGMIVFAMEGAICLLMAAPIGYALAMFGGLVGYAIQARPWSMEHNPLVLLALVVTLPTLLAAEAAAPQEPEVLAVSSVVEIEAPPDRVWNQVVSFPELSEPDDWVFQTGVAYPLRAEIQGRGVGAVRHCVFSTGEFVEPIDAWDEPNRLAFRVAEQPEPMREWSPYSIHPPHLHGYLVSRRGEFRLTALEGGRTRLEGVTWYTNRMWPASYWRLWSDAIIHRIHLRVLDHIKQLAEQGSETGDGK